MRQFFKEIGNQQIINILYFEIYCRLDPYDQRLIPRKRKFEKTALEILNLFDRK